MCWFFSSRLSLAALRFALSACQVNRQIAGQPAPTNRQAGVFQSYPVHPSLPTSPRHLTDPLPSSLIRTEDRPATVQAAGIEAQQTAKGRRAQRRRAVIDSSNPSASRCLLPLCSFSCCLAIHSPGRTRPTTALQNAGPRTSPPPV